jgi:hypothetical protein
MDNFTNWAVNDFSRTFIDEVRYFYINLPGLAPASYFGRLLFGLETFHIP